MPRTCTLMQKAIECLECPERWPRPMNGYGHFREGCDVIKRHLARLCNFGTLRPKINPCPMEQPQPRCALPHSCRNPKKRLRIWLRARARARAIGRVPKWHPNWEFPSQYRVPECNGSLARGYCPQIASPLSPSSFSRVAASLFSMPSVPM